MPGQLGGQRIPITPQVGAAGVQQPTTAQSSMQHGYPGSIHLQLPNFVSCFFITHLISAHPQLVATSCGWAYVTVCAIKFTFVL